MLSIHHSFSTRIFLAEPAIFRPAAAAAGVSATRLALKNHLLRWSCAARKSLEGPRPCGPQMSARHRPAGMRALPERVISHAR